MQVLSLREIVVLGRVTNVPSGEKRMRERGVQQVRRAAREAAELRAQPHAAQQQQPRRRPGSGRDSAAKEPHSVMR